MEKLQKLVDAKARWLAEEKFKAMKAQEAADAAAQARADTSDDEKT